MKDYYTTSDRALEMLAKKAAKRISDCKARLGVLKFDEISVLRKISEMYDAMNQDNMKAFLELAGVVFRKVRKELSDDYPEYFFMKTGKTIAEEPTKTWLNRDVLGNPNPLTKYIYEYEKDRKAEKAAEAVNAVKTREAKNAELTKHGKYWMTQTRYYADYITDEAVKKAYKSVGVEKVKWVTAKDEKVCSECSPLDGKVFDLDGVPTKPHLNCRCMIVPYIGKE